MAKLTLIIEDFVCPVTGEAGCALDARDIQYLQGKVAGEMSLAEMMAMDMLKYCLDRCKDSGGHVESSDEIPTENND